MTEQDSKNIAIQGFLGLAKEYEELHDAIPVKKTRAAGIYHVNLEIRAGDLFVKCAREGWLAGLPVDEIIEWLDGKECGQQDPDDPSLLRSPAFVRCSSNAFGVFKGFISSSLSPSLYSRMPFISASMDASKVESHELGVQGLRLQFRESAEICRFLAKRLDGREGNSANTLSHKTSKRNKRGPKKKDNDALAKAVRELDSRYVFTNIENQTLDGRIQWKKICRDYADILPPNCDDGRLRGRVRTMKDELKHLPKKDR